MNAPFFDENMNPSICLVIPCYNEEARLDTQAYQHYFNQELQFRFLFVDDGSTDQTWTILSQYAQDYSNVEALKMPCNGGKSSAVRAGMLRAIDFATDYIGYWDADLATPLDQLALFKPYLNQQAQVVMGSRIQRLGSEIIRLRTRHYTGRIFATAASLVVGLPIYDTQCGAKLFKRDLVHTAFEEPFMSKWIFDVEVLARLVTQRQLNRLDLVEVPLEKWRDVNSTKIKLMDFIRAPFELISIYTRYRRGF